MVGELLFSSARAEAGDGDDCALESVGSEAAGVAAAGCGAAVVDGEGCGDWVRVVLSPQDWRMRAMPSASSEAARRRGWHRRWAMDRMVDP